MLWKMFGEGSLCTWGNTKVWAVHFLGFNDFDEIYFFVLSKDQTFRNSCAFINPAQFMILVTHLINMIEECPFPTYYLTQGWPKLRQKTRIQNQKVYDIMVFVIKWSQIKPANWFGLATPDPSNRFVCIYHSRNLKRFYLIWLEPSSEIKKSFKKIAYKEERTRLFD